MPAQNGAVDMRRSVPPNGATSTLPEALTKWMETRPAAAAISAQSPTRPMWPALRSATIDRPIALHLSMPICTACGATVWPKPYRPSTTASTGVSVLISTLRSATTAPSCLPLQVARHPHHAVAVMAGQVGPDQVFADALAFGRPSSRP